MIRDTIQEQIQQVMKAGDVIRVSTLVCRQQQMSEEEG